VSAVLSNALGFCGEVPWRLISALVRGEEVRACYIVRDARRQEAKNGNAYLRLVLGDRTGTIDAMVWEEVDRWEPLCPVDAIVGVRAKVGNYQDRLQLSVSRIEPLQLDPAELEQLIPAAPRPREEMERELDRLISSVQDTGLLKLLRRCLGRGTELGRAFRTHPAAKRNHHAYLCGLLEHTLSVALLADGLARHYVGQGVEVDRDLLVSGALLHDLGKVRELKALPASGYTTEGQLLGHIVLGIQLVEREAAGVAELSSERLLLLQHLIASHQGKPEWDSPKVPQLVEGLLLHYADDLDAKLNQARTLLDGVGVGEWSPYDRGFGRSFYQPDRLIRREESDAPVPEATPELFMDLFPR
jgi:3'-5' exoribonuclease